MSDNRQADVADLTDTQTVIEACHQARKCEEAGDYEKACAWLRPWWQPHATPSLSGLELPVAAELLLRAGALVGWLSGSKSGDEMGKKSQGLLNQSLALFRILGDAGREAEARVELGVAYYRAGAFGLATDEYQAALKHLANNGPADILIVALIRRALLERQSLRWHEALATLDEVARLLQPSHSDSLHGRYFVERATTLKSLGQAKNDWELLKEASAHFDEAGRYFKKAGHLRYCAGVLNNLGNLLAHLGQFEEAQSSLERARNLYLELEDPVHAAYVEESRAQLLIKLRRYEEASHIIERVVKVCRQSSSEPYLIEALLTQGLVLAQLKRTVAARYAFNEALHLAERGGDYEGSGRAALLMVEELGENLSLAESQELLARAGHLLRNTKNAALQERLQRQLAHLAEAEAAEKRRHDQAIQHDKMAALGQLAFGVAHDFKNTLTAIKGRTQLLQRLPLPTGSEKNLKIILQAVHESAEVIERIQDFGRQRPERAFTTLNLVALVQSLVDLAQPHCATRGVTLKAERLRLAWVKGDAAELKEVLMNLIYNAVDATGTGGIINLSLAQNEQQVEIRVTDNGKGMSPAVCARIFEPFFSTKGKRGTGMGLAVSYGIIQRHGGTIEVESAEGVGTTFKITLPVPMKIVKEIPLHLESMGWEYKL